MQLKNNISKRTTENCFKDKFTLGLSVMHEDNLLKTPQGNN